MSHPRFVLSRSAAHDIEEIWTYTVESWDLDQAEAYLRAIQRTIDRLVHNPRLGRACDDIRAGYRRYPIASHVIFYRVDGGAIHVVRILHRRMDVGMHL